MYKLLRPLLFLLDAERAHRLVTRSFKWLMALGILRRWVGRRFRVAATELSQEVMGIRFPNPVGLAAGFDKNAELYVEMAALGFGFVEVGTVTARPQPGNPRPRLFRLPSDRALVNRFGFNNEGARRVARRLEERSAPTPIGVNIGRSKVVPNEQAVEDYRESLERLWPYASYITVNVSSPNTPELRALQARDRLGPLLQSLRADLDERAREAKRTPPPLLVKVSPDLGDDELDGICAVIEEHGIDGVIATNTTVSREGLRTPAERVDRMGPGGLSGLPLRARSLQVLALLRNRLGPEFPIIATGGISDAESAWRAITAGARLIQVYTGLIYEGPGLIRSINHGLARRLRERGLSSIEGAVGMGVTEGA